MGGEDFEGGWGAEELWEGTTLIKLVQLLEALRALSFPIAMCPGDNTQCPDTSKKLPALCAHVLPGMLQWRLKLGTK